MSRRRMGVVVGKDFKPPAGASHANWCYLVVDISEGDLVSVRLDKSQVDKAVLGDWVVFKQPRRSDKPVHRVTRL